jgi:hypothetical protein
MIAGGKKQSETRVSFFAVRVNLSCYARPIYDQVISFQGLRVTLEN